MSEVAMIAASLAASPRFATAMEQGTPLDALAAAMLIKRQARAMGSPVGDLSLREIAVQLGMREIVGQLGRRSVLADGPRVDVRVEVQP